MVENPNTCQDLLIMSEIKRKVEKVVHGHQYETNDTGKGDLHDSNLANKLDPRVRTEDGEY